MAAPTAIATIATDATYTADADPWSGAATKVDPGSTRIAEGFEPDLLPAPWLNFVLNAITAWINYIKTYLNTTSEEFVYPTAKTRKKTILPIAPGTFTTAGAASEWFPSTIGNSPILLPLVNGAKVWIPIDLPSGCTISAVEAIVRSSVNRSTPNGWIVKAFEQSENWATPAAPTTTQQGSSTEGGLSSGYSKITVGSLTPWIIVNEYTAHVEVTAPTGSVGATDALVALRITFTDGGPRNA